MNDELKQKIETVRDKLQNESLAMIIGKLNEGKNCEKSVSIKSYCDFLKICNGARCGSIDLWSEELLANNQYRVLELDGADEKWMCIGQVLYEPLVIDLDTEDVYLFCQGCENEIDGKCFGKLDIFLSDYVFGEKSEK